MYQFKRILLALLVIAGSSQIASAQSKGQLTALQEIGDGSVFKEYYGVTKEGSSWSALWHNH